MSVFEMTHVGINSWDEKWSVALSAARINKLRGSLCCVRTGFLPPRAPLPQIMSQLQI